MNTVTSAMVEKQAATNSCNKIAVGRFLPWQVRPSLPSTNPSLHEHVKEPSLLVQSVLQGLYITHSSMSEGIIVGGY